MSKNSGPWIGALALLAILALCPGARAQAPTSCARPATGSAVAPPPSLSSKRGVLNVALDYVTSLDAQNRTLFCFVTPDGEQSPTLHVKPGDTLSITVTNMVPLLDEPTGAALMIEPATACADKKMQSGAVNIHFHGLNVSPTCGSDEVIHTLINPQHTFTYTIKIPNDEPPGLYWYHPHVHGYSDAAVLGGATGLIVVDGIEILQPAVAGLPTRELVLRSLTVVDDQAKATTPMTAQAALAAAAKIPSWDLSLNYVPINYPALIPARLLVKPGQKEFWRVANTTADTIVDLQLKVDGVAQRLFVAAYDGVPTFSQDGFHRGRVIGTDHVFIPPAGRAEFIIPPIPSTAKSVTLETRRIDTGPAGDTDTARVIATIEAPRTEAELAMANPPVMPASAAAPGPRRFEGLDQATVTATRHLYFFEIFPDPKDPNEGLFYITVDGQTPQLFNPNAPPAITTTKGAVEDWVIENHTQEVHEFHIHQIHFQVRDIDHQPVSEADRQVRDTYQVPYWTGTGPYPSVTLRMDFRGAVVGDFVYHCHILDHEDAGMMAIVRVQPPS